MQSFFRHFPVSEFFNSTGCFANDDYERACGWYGHFNKSEMALFSECTDRYAQNMLDTADIVREAIFRQLSI